MSLMALGALTVVAADAANLIAAHDRAITAAQGETANLSRSLAEQAHGMFQAMDTILVGLRERVETDGTGPAAAQRLEKLLRLRIQALPFVHRIMVVDETGRVLLASGAEAIGKPPQSDSGRSVFLHHAGDEDRASFLGWPVRDRFDGSMVLPVSRRIDHPDGSFAGLVVASVNAKFFQQAYSGFDTGREGVILLARDDAVALARWPADPLGEARDLSKGEFFSKIVGPGNRLHFQYTSVADGLLRVSSYYRIPGEPALLLVGRGRHEVLAGWRMAAAAHAIGLCVVLGTIGLLGYRLIGKVGEVERARNVLTQTNQRLAASEESARRANAWLQMAEQVARVGHWHIDFGGAWMPDSKASHRIVWSDELYQIHGLQKQGCRVSHEVSLSCYHPQDRATVAAATDAALRHAAPYEFKARLVRPDGSMRHVLARGRPEMDIDGKVVGGFGVVMDITEQRLSEDALQAAHADVEAANKALEAANLALEVLALQDSLTALDNRRCFDRTLEDAFRQQGHTAMPLSLVMVDVDYFKQYNDIYGHQAGDACLRSIAAVIPPLLRRSGDTASRYGGEEMAVLLPGSTEASALIVAERIAKEVLALAIPHAGSPHGLVTISAGIGSLVPLWEARSQAELVKQADMALYAAKRGGRNRVALFSDASAETPAALQV